MEIKKKKVERKDNEVVAKKDWHIVQNEFDVKIKEGEQIPSLPDELIQALKTENVI